MSLPALLLVLANAPVLAEPPAPPRAEATASPAEVIVLLRPGVTREALLAAHPGITPVRTFAVLRGFVARGRAAPRVGLERPSPRSQGAGSQPNSTFDASSILGTVDGPTEFVSS